MVEKTVAYLFKSFENANATANRLEAVNIDRKDISVISNATPLPGGAQSSDYAAPILPGAPVIPAVPVAGAGAPELGFPGTDRRIGQTSAEADRSTVRDAANIAQWLTEEGVDPQDAHSYAQGVHDGGVLLVVKCDDSNVSQVVSIISDAGL